MKITWDNIDDFKLTKRGYFRRNNKSMVLRDGDNCCPVCGEPYFTKQSLIKEDKGLFCGKSCSGKEISKNINRNGKNNPCWRGGLVKLNLCTYSTYEPQLSPYGIKCRRSPQDKNILQVKCHLYECDNWYEPIINECIRKIQTLKGNKNYRGEQNIFCSDDCKKKCKSYGRKPDDIIRHDGILSGIIKQNDISREVQPELRQLVFERDGYTCQRCNTKGTLHCHHFTGIEQNPIESADIDNCITLCVNCHKKVHKQTGCTYNDLKCK